MKSNARECIVNLSSMLRYCACLNLQTLWKIFLWNSCSSWQPRYSACAYSFSPSLPYTWKNQAVYIRLLLHWLAWIRCLIKLWFNNNKSKDNKFISYKLILPSALKLNSYNSLSFMCAFFSHSCCRFKFRLSWAWLWSR